MPSGTVGYMPEVPGVNAQERTLAAARRSLLEALHELGELLPEAVPSKHRRIVATTGQRRGGRRTAKAVA